MSDFLSSTIALLSGIFGVEQKKAEKTAKELATEKNEIYFVANMNGFDTNDPLAGFFEFEWNDEAIKQLRILGFQGKTDEQIIDNYFTHICKSVAMELYENQQSDPQNRISAERTELDNGRAEYK